MPDVLIIVVCVFVFFCWGVLVFVIATAVFVVVSEILLFCELPVVDVGDVLAKIL